MVDPGIFAPVPPHTMDQKAQWNKLATEALDFVKTVVMKKKKVGKKGGKQGLNLTPKEAHDLLEGAIDHLMKEGMSRIMRKEGVDDSLLVGDLTRALHLAMRDRAMLGYLIVAHFHCDQEDVADDSSSTSSSSSGPKLMGREELESIYARSEPPSIEEWKALRLETALADAKAKYYCNELVQARRTVAALKAGKDPVVEKTSSAFRVAEAFAGIPYMHMSLPYLQGLLRFSNIDWMAAQRKDSGREAALEAAKKDVERRLQELIRDFESFYTEHEDVLSHGGGKGRAQGEGDEEEEEEEEEDDEGEGGEEG
jgi:hypothetical protein